MKHLFRGLMALGLLVGLAGHANAQPTYSFTTIDVPGATDTWASGINASGQIVGNSSLGGFLLDQGSYATIDPPGSSTTWANGINDSGQIVGWYEDPTGQHGFLLDQGSYTEVRIMTPRQATISGQQYHPEDICLCRGR